MSPLTRQITKYSGDVARIEADPDLTQPDVLSERQIASRLGLPCPPDDAEASREYRRRASVKERQRAYYAVKQAVKHGELADLKAEVVSCVDCGKRAILYEHRDYRAPLTVEPVCAQCNCDRGNAKGIFKPDNPPVEWNEEELEERGLLPDESLVLPSQQLSRRSRRYD